MQCETNTENDKQRKVTRKEWLVGKRSEQKNENRIKPFTHIESDSFEFWIFHGYALFAIGFQLNIH